MTRTHRTIRTAFAAWTIAAVLGLLGAACYSASRSETLPWWSLQSSPTAEEVAPEECPGGVEWNSWCGCEPPIYGDDC